MKLASSVVRSEDDEAVADGGPRDVLTADLLTGVYDYPVEFVDHPGGGAPIVLPRR